MAESSLSITYTDLLVEVAAYLGYGPTAANWTAAQVLEIDRYVQSGVRQFYYPPAIQGVPPGHEWSFLRPTGTITTADGDGEQDLPDNFGRVLGNFYYAVGQYRASIPVVSEAMVLASRSRTSDESYPAWAAIRPKAQVAGSGQRLEVAWAPVPNAIYVLTFRYEAYSGKLTAQNPYPLGGMKYAELLTESCLAMAEQRANDGRGEHTAAFERLLIDGIARDRKQGARHFGLMMTDEDESPSRFPGAGENYPVTYKGSTW